MNEPDFVGWTQIYIVKEPVWEHTADSSLCHHGSGFPSGVWTLAVLPLRCMEGMKIRVRASTEPFWLDDIPIERENELRNTYP